MSRLHITFICTGNICRSPMAEKMFAQQLADRGLADAVRVTSAGTADWHVGKGADKRTNRVLQAHGYPTEHAAAHVGSEHLQADLLVAMARNHARILRRRGAPRDRVRLIRSFGPARDTSAVDVSDVEDPYYGTHRDFERVFGVLAESLPGLHTWVDRRLHGDQAHCDSGVH